MGEATSPSTPFLYFIYMNKSFKIVIKFKRLIQNIMRNLERIPHEKKQFGQFRISPILLMSYYTSNIAFEIKCI